MASFCAASSGLVGRFTRSATAGAGFSTADVMLDGKGGHVMERHNGITPGRAPQTRAVENRSGANVEMGQKYGHDRGTWHAKLPEWP
jgi:hypothetical protein